MARAAIIRLIPKLETKVGHIACLQLGRRTNQSNAWYRSVVLERIPTSRSALDAGQCKASKIIAGIRKGSRIEHALLEASPQPRSTTVLARSLKYMLLCETLGGLCVPAPGRYTRPTAPQENCITPSWRNAQNFILKPRSLPGASHAAVGTSSPVSHITRRCYRGGPGRGKASIMHQVDGLTLPP
ncbi:hypothetical protein DQ04_10441010 [Trypanosoma grayi]|uniref:hypothetical protein n=1 Tax=Trypanosoma grayi TaxID=71804 RepID=UPI0004F4B4D3|nr:hypothetical protein DQ04_10441010 [Trypanosoma grayi]KEG07244.1 hypothetical protein DQ04_10441010 [Trypanosoma grayi]